MFFQGMKMLHCIESGILSYKSMDTHNITIHALPYYAIQCQDIMFKYNVKTVLFEQVVGTLQVLKGGHMQMTLWEQQIHFIMKFSFVYRDMIDAYQNNVSQPFNTSYYSLNK